ncbi:hypothetical protein ACMFMG_009826 [Clarireedia jacksonii]
MIQRRKSPSRSSSRPPSPQKEGGEEVREKAIAGSPTSSPPPSTTRQPPSHLHQASHPSTIKLKLWSELETWQQEDNNYIETGYRAATASLWDCFASWGYLHNETINIWSHLIGAALFASLPVYLYRAELPSRYAAATKADVVVCVIYFVGVAICFSLSALYHTVMCHSQKMDTFGAQLDFQGVILLMWGATVPLVYYGFYCDSASHRIFYWIFLSMLAIACSVSTFQPRFRDPYLRPIRAATFGSLALFTMVPVIHGAAKHGWEVQNQRMGITWVLMTLLLNVLGATAYAIKVSIVMKWYASMTSSSSRRTCC